MRNQTPKNLVGLIWLAGLVLAAIVYIVGPERILYAGIGAIDQAREALRAIAAAFALDTLDVLRALTLGLMPVFLVLCALASRRGIAVMRVLVVVVVLLLLLLYEPAHSGWYISSTRWTIAFIAVAIGCAVMSRRLSDPDGGDPRWATRARGP